jgi:hypothetical protein
MKIIPLKLNVISSHDNMKTSIADPDDFGLDLDPTHENNADPDPSLCKILYQHFVTRNFCLKIALY